MGNIHNLEKTIKPMFKASFACSFIAAQALAVSFDQPTTFAQISSEMNMSG